ncbi:hypothetical protein AB0L53_01245 [Nonomuraea sp. NPDC052129]|uniref:hypothetical protein n=1 Tax=Nonomuraea sp. NPDC052129 TaxID=3154651 RepID=UPI00342EC662
MTSDELKVPSQRADQTDDDAPRDDFRANDTPTADLSREDSVRDERSRAIVDEENDENDEGNGARHHEPYAPAGGDMLAEPEPGLSPDPVRDEPEYTDDVPGEPVVVESAPAHAAPQSVVLFDQDPAEVQGRWRELQTSFVDDPSDAVQRAEGLVEEVVEAITSGLTARTGELRDRWKGAGDTEQLRLALRDYRVVLERLLTLSGYEASHATGPATGHETSHATDTAYGTR